MSSPAVLPTDGNRLVRVLPALRMAHRMVERELVVEIDPSEPAVYVRLYGCVKRERIAGADRLRMTLRRLYGREDARQGLLPLADEGGSE